MWVDDWSEITGVESPHLVHSAGEAIPLISPYFTLKQSWYFVIDCSPPRPLSRLARKLSLKNYILLPARRYAFLLGMRIEGHVLKNQ